MKIPLRINDVYIGDVEFGEELPHQHLSRDTFEAMALEAFRNTNKRATAAHLWVLLRKTEDLVVTLSGCATVCQPESRFEFDPPYLVDHPEWLEKMAQSASARIAHLKRPLRLEYSEARGKLAICY